jgi:shikimate kinase
VLATGGGVVERAANRERLLRETTCVRLVVPPARLRQRLAADPTFRPALHPASEGSNPLDEIEAVLERREPLYKATCHFTLDGEADDIEGLAARIQAWLESSS